MNSTKYVLRAYIANRIFQLEFDNLDLSGLEYITVGDVQFRIIEQSFVVFCNIVGVMYYHLTPEWLLQNKPPKEATEIAIEALQDCNFTEV